MRPHFSMIGHSIKKIMCKVSSHLVQQIEEFFRRNKSELMNGQTNRQHNTITISFGRDNKAQDSKQ